MQDLCGVRANEHLSFFKARLLGWDCTSRGGVLRGSIPMHKQLTSKQITDVEKYDLNMI